VDDRSQTEGLSSSMGSLWPSGGFLEVSTQQYAWLKFPLCITTFNRMGKTNPVFDQVHFTAVDIFSPQE